MILDIPFGNGVNSNLSQDPGRSSSLNQSHGNSSSESSLVTVTSVLLQYSHVAVVLHSDSAIVGHCDVFTASRSVSPKIRKNVKQDRSLQCFEAVLHLLGRDVLSVQRPALSKNLGAFEPTDEHRIETGVPD
jgi:hypothetical protein